MSEEKIREAIRQHLRDDFGVGGETGEGRAFKPHGSDQDHKLDLADLPKSFTSTSTDESSKAAEVPLFDQEKPQKPALDFKDKVDQEVLRMLEKKKKSKEEAVAEANAKKEQEEADAVDAGTDKLKKYLLKRKSSVKK